MLVGESGAGALDWFRSARWITLNSGGVQAGGIRKGSHSVGRCETPRRSRKAAKSTVPGVRAA